ncbi:MAG: hypothetical protein U0V56_00870 [Actinomycetota bacterium]
MRSRPRSMLPFAVALMTLLAACSGDGGGTDPTGPSSPSGAAPPTLAAQVASTDLYANAAQRVQVGVFSSTQDGTQLLTFGQVQFAFSYLGADGSGQPVAGPVATASYVPAPGTPKGSGSPALSDPADARGVYEADDVELDRAGVWVVEVTAEVPGSGPQRLQAAFTVAEEPNLLIPGDDALRTRNLTMDSEDAPPQAIDSRAQDGNPVPDPGSIAGRSRGRSRSAGPPSCSSRRPCTARASSAVRPSTGSSSSPRPTRTGPSTSTSRSGATTRRA